VTQLAIRASGVSKRYRIGERQRYKSLRETIMRRLSAGLNRHAPSEEQIIWALRDVSFEIPQGEAVGIIGRNGAGKSTLLKILSRITQPTQGRVEIQGRVGSLLEVGTGFHLELTGRENIFLSGAILGMKRAEIQRKFDEIVAFAEIDKFIDTPVKRYSSGMYLRLAFAVAAHLEPEILVIDEVLAVGDAAFQKKCLGKMGDVAGEGRTVLFVSHDLGAVHRLTRSCLLLRNGTVAMYGHSGVVIRSHLEEALKPPIESRGLEHFRRSRAGRSGVRFVQLETDHDRDGSIPTIRSGTDFTITMRVLAESEIHGANLTCTIKNEIGQRIAMLFSWDQHFMVDLVKGDSMLQVTIRGLPLAPGLYFADFGLNQATETMALDVLLDVPLLRVSPSEGVTQWLNRPWGAIHWDQVEWKLAHR
jgi:lipopolysaccharide transport system ATP-binding protein